MKIGTLQTKKQVVQSKCEGCEKLVLKFSKGQENLDKLLGSQRMSFDKEGIGYNIFNKKKVYKNFFVQSTAQNISHICNYYIKNGQMSYSCSFRKSSPRLVQIWIPKCIRPPNVN